MLLPHEQLDEHVRTYPGYNDELQHRIEENEMPETYHSNETVSGADGPVAAYGVYIDGVSFTRSDTTLGFWVYDFITRCRFLVGVLRKSCLCACGCKGHCSIWAMCNVLAWSMRALLAGVYPCSDHKNTPWGADDARSLKAGQPLEVPFVCVEIKGGWAEFVTTLGFCGWKTLASPCPMCFADRTSWFDVHACTGPDQLLWVDMTGEDYEAACELCEKTVTLHSAAEHLDLRSKLRYDKAKQGIRGRVLSVDLPDLGLLAGDRLDPSEGCTDTGIGFDMHTDFPLTVTFWRRSLETKLRKRFPLFSVPGVDCTFMTIDLLHTLYLGPAQHFVIECVWSTVCANVYNVSGPNESTRDQTCLARMLADIKRWYRENQVERYSQIRNLQMPMVGTRADHEGTAPFKAAECKALVFFCTEHLLLYPDAAPSLLRAGQHLVRFIDCMRHAPVQLSEETVREMFTHWHYFVVLSCDGGVKMFPKTHLMYHLISRASRHGNPVSYTCFLDESLNRNLAAVARSAYAPVWERRIFHKFKMGKIGSVQPA